MRIVDLSCPIDADAWEPDAVTHTVLSPAEGARHMAEEMNRHFGVDFDPAVLPGGELLSLDTFTLTTHTGTHVDAPAHYGSAATIEYGEPRTTDQLPLDWFLRPAVVLDLREQPPGAVGASVVEKAIVEVGYRPRPLDIVLLHTGAWSYAGTQRYFTEFTGLTGDAVELLLDLGVRVIGTDAFSLDAPFGEMLRQYQATGDRSVLWPAHFIGRRREYCQIERLHNLDALPAPYGFQLSCLPVKLARAGAGWARAVALFED